MPLPVELLRPTAASASFCVKGSARKARSLYQLAITEACSCSCSGDNRVAPSFVVLAFAMLYETMLAFKPLSTFNAIKPAQSWQIFFRLGSFVLG